MYTEAIFPSVTHSILNNYIGISTVLKLLLKQNAFSSRFQFINICSSVSVTFKYRSTTPFFLCFLMSIHEDKKKCFLN